MQINSAIVKRFKREGLSPVLNPKSLLPPIKKRKGKHLISLRPSKRAAFVIKRLKLGRDSILIAESVINVTSVSSFSSFKELYNAVIKDLKKSKRHPKYRISPFSVSKVLIELSNSKALVPRR
jgi:hypothetical protein